jgi:hypothetical protein
MFIIFNYLGGGVAVLGFFLSLVVAGRMAMGDRDVFVTRFPLVLGTILIAVDLVIRCYRWRRIAARCRGETILTREGVVPAPRSHGRELLEAFFHPEAGGQLFFLPVWLIGAACIAWSLAGPALAGAPDLPPARRTA